MGGPGVVLFLEQLQSLLSKIVWLFAYKTRIPLSHFLIDLILVSLMYQEPPSQLILITWNLSGSHGRARAWAIFSQFRGCTGVTFTGADVLIRVECPNPWFWSLPRGWVLSACSKHLSILSFLIVRRWDRVISFNPTSSGISGLSFIFSYKMANSYPLPHIVLVC